MAATLLIILTFILSCETQKERILNATEVSTYETLPYMVSLYRQDYTTSIGYFEYICGATHITPMWILSAAHCFRMFKVLGTNSRMKPLAVKGTMVVRGAGILTSTPQAQVREFLIFIIHEKYNIVQNDIAVARIKKSFSRKPSVPIFLANGKALENKEINVYYESCLQVGRGITNPVYYYYDYTVGKFLTQIGGTASHHYRIQNITVISKRKCYQDYENVIMNFPGVTQLLPKRVIENLICTKYYPGNKGICFGDSGGPLLCGNIQYGVAAAGITCGVSRVGLLMWTPVYLYQDWVKKYAPGVQFTSLREYNNRNCGDATHDFMTTACFIILSSLFLM